MNCMAYCLSKTFIFDEMKDFLIENEKAAIYRDVLHLMKFDGDVFIFPYGTIVTWGVSHDDTKWLFDAMEPYCNEPHEIPFRDEFTFSTGNDRTRIHNDHIELTGADTVDLMAVSHGVAQSVKLSELEDYVGQTIDSTSHIPQTIAKTGKTKLSRRKIARLRGTLHLVETEINLKFELLDTPEFFWEFPDVEYLFDMTVRYLDTRSRVEILNKKLTVIHDLLLMLADEQNHKHLAILEWIIIWLIAFEIFYFITQEILKRIS